MTDFSAGRAIGAGFGVIRRKPLAILAWGAVYFVGAILPQGLLWAKLGPVLAAQGTGQAPDPQALAAASGGMLGLAPLYWLLALAVSSILYGAIFRAVLEPQDDRFLYLRLSARELWLGLTILAIAVVFAIGVVVVGVVLGIVSPNLPWLLRVLLFLAVFVAAVWLGLRFSLAGPMAFAERRFIFADVWPLTAGHALKLFGVLLALVCILLALELVVILPIGLALGMSGALKALGGGAPAAVGQIMPMMAGIGVLIALFAAVALAIVGAPWAEIYRELTGGAEPPRA